MILISAQPQHWVPLQAFEKCGRRSWNSHTNTAFNIYQARDEILMSFGAFNFFLSYLMRTSLYFDLESTIVSENTVWKMRKWGKYSRCCGFFLEHKNFFVWARSALSQKRHLWKLMITSGVLQHLHFLLNCKLNTSFRKC